MSDAIDAKARAIAHMATGCDVEPQRPAPGWHTNKCDDITTAIADAMRAQFEAGTRAGVERAIAHVNEFEGRAKSNRRWWEAFGNADAVRAWTGRQLTAHDIADELDQLRAALPASPPSDPRPGAETVERCPRCKRPRRILANGVACWNTGGPYCIPRDEPAAPQAEPRDEGALSHDELCDVNDIDPAIGRPTKPCNCNRWWHDSRRCRCGHLVGEHPGETGRCANYLRCLCQGFSPAAPVTRPAGEPVEARAATVAESATVGEAQTGTKKGGAE
jgi:hypothetical protein